MSAELVEINSKRVDQCAHEKKVVDTVRHFLLTLDKFPNPGLAVIHIWLTLKADPQNRVTLGAALEQGLRQLSELLPKTRLYFALKQGLVQNQWRLMALAYWPDYERVEAGISAALLEQAAREIKSLLEDFQILGEMPEGRDAQGRRHVTEIIALVG